MEDTHMAVWEAESTAPTAWDRWIATVESLLGHDLDGSFLVDGFSLDTTFDMFNAGLNPLQATARINADKSLGRIHVSE